MRSPDSEAAQQGGVIAGAKKQGSSRAELIRKRRGRRRSPNTDIDWESPAMRERRRALKSDPRVLAALKAWWNATDVDKGMVVRVRCAACIGLTLLPWLVPALF